MLFFSTVKIFYSDHWKSDTYTVYFILLLECLRSSNKFFTFETSDEKSLLIRFATINFPLRSPVDALCIFRVEKFRMYTYVHKKIKPICTNASWACQIARNKYNTLKCTLQIFYIFLYLSHLTEPRKWWAFLYHHSWHYRVVGVRLKIQPLRRFFEDGGAKERIL